MGKVMRREPSLGETVLGGKGVLIPRAGMQGQAVYRPTEDGEDMPRPSPSAAKRVAQLLRRGKSPK
jgi:hypothetical protein